MTRALLAAVLIALAVSSTALAKGPREATLEGPGLDSPIVFGGFWKADRKDHEALQPFLEAFGFFPAAFGTTPQAYNTRLPGRPKRDLGPRYTVTYDLGQGTDGDEELVVQDLYPYAKPNAVTYMAPGQTFWGRSRTRGGWFAARSPATPPILRAAGLPRTPPTAGDAGEIPWPLVAALTALGTVLGIGALAGLKLRRRPHPAT